MVNLVEKSNDIIKVLFWLDLILLIVSIFWGGKGFLITSGIINVILLGSFLILKKYAYVFEGLVQAQRMFKGIVNVLDKL